jgi:Asp-tRNA(Asn)/Glu-tRNA(Gln) amidotransferase A subunit family amidase
MRFLFIFLFFFHLAFADEFNALIEEYPLSNKINVINIVIKDNIDIKGKATTAGSLALVDNIAKENAFLIEKLLANNFHIKGKSNLSEWANFRSINSISGWSSINGQTTHPMDTEYNPCGSSSGSAVAVASGIVDIAIGTETNGSITCPASVVGIVGMKPTVGLVSRQGIIPIASSQDTAGPMGKSVKIVAQTLQAISGEDINDIKTKDIPQNLDQNFIEATNNKTLEGKRFGLLKSGFDNKFGKEFLKKIERDIANLGGTIVLIDDKRNYPSEEEYFVLLYEFKHGLESYLKTAFEKKKSLQELIDFNNANSEKVMRLFGQEIFYAAIEASSNKDKYLESLEILKASTKETILLMDRYKLDAFIGLTRGPAWKTNKKGGGDNEAMNEVISFGNGGYAAIGGLPHITIPYFSINGFQVGLSLIGKPWSDKEIISYASALEH